MTGSIQVTIEGQGRFAGTAANITNYSVTEDGSSLNLEDTQGGVGGVNFTVQEDSGFNGSILLPGQPFTLSDPYAGRIGGIVDSGGVNDDAELSITGATKMLPFVAQRAIPAFSGTLDGALAFYASLVGLTAGLQVHPSLMGINVAIPSYTGEVWTLLKRLAAIYQFEIATVGSNIVIRPPRLRMVDVRKYSSTRLSYGNDQASRAVEVYYYNNEWKVDAQVFPKADTSVVDRQIITVDANETTTTNVPVDMWISTIDQPEQVGSISSDATTSNSIYSVVDKDGQMVTVTDWQNGGGLVTYALGVDGKSVDVTVRGMSTDTRSPYRIASSSADLEYQYGTLFIVATGVAFKRKMISSGTGANELGLPVDSVVTVDDPAVSTLQQAQLVLSRAVMSLSGVSQTFEATATSVNRRGDTGEVAYPTFGQFDAAWVGKTFAQFDAAWVGQTFTQFDAYQASLVAGDFETQAFGGIGGARVRERDAIYRIASATSSPGDYNWTATLDTLFSDWAAVYSAPMTFGQFDTIWAGKTFEQHARMPLHI